MIDGTHIAINAPKKHTVSYFNRKSYYSVVLQGVCDNRNLFTDVYAGQPGSMHDYCVFEKSDLYECILNRTVTFPDNSHILGDLAYKLSQNVLVGFKQNRALNERETKFNVTLSKCRVCIEHTFALLKGRFRRLKFVESQKLDVIVLLIISACILHNICIMKGDFLDGVINIDDEINEIRQTDANEQIDDDNNRDGVQKRLNIVNSL